MLSSVNILFYLRKEHQIRVRCPGLSLLLGVLACVYVILLQINVVKGLPCNFVLWFGNILTIFLLVFGILKDWSILVMSDRMFRKKYRWTLQPVCMLSVAALFFGVTVVSTLMVHFFSKDYFNMARGGKCHFIFPWWEFLPQLIPSFLFRIVIASKIKSKTENFEPDYFGVSLELKIVQRVAVPVLASYLTYTHFFLEGQIDSKFPGEYIMMVLPITGCLSNVTVPCIKTVLNKKQSKGTKRFAQTLLVRIPRSKRSIFEEGKESRIKVLLRSTDPNEVDKFNKHAQRSFCGESVDFCSEVLSYKNRCARMSLESMQEKQILHAKFLEIVHEFVISGAPSEVNLSSAQKQDILKFLDADFFSSLSPLQITSIFDEAENEIEYLLSPVLNSFENEKNGN